VVVIDRNSPLGPAADAVASYMTAKRQRAVDDAASAHTADRESRQDLESDRTYGLASNRDAREAQTAADTHSKLPGELQAQSDTHTKTQSELATASITQKKAQLDIVYQQQKQPLELEYDRLRNKAESGAILTASDLHQQHLIENKLKSIELQYAAQSKQLDLLQKQASIARDKAETVRALRPPAASKPSAYERQEDAFNDAQGALSPQGSSFLDMLSNTNNPPTRMQALEALAQSRLSGGDKKALQTIIESRESQFESPGQQTGQDYRQGRDQKLDARYDTSQSEKRGEQLYHDVAKGKAYDALTPRLKSLVHTAIVGHNMSVQEAMDAVSTSSLPDDDKSAISTALGGS
jgi:hypothetical protein